MCATRRRNCGGASINIVVPTRTPTKIGTFSAIPEFDVELREQVLVRNDAAGGGEDPVLELHAHGAVLGAASRPSDAAVSSVLRELRV